MMFYQNLPKQHYLVVTLLACLFFITAPLKVQAASAAEIDIGVTETLKNFRSEVPGGGKFLQRAEGVLVFPKVIKAGFGIGGEYGEGALLINGQTVDYYSTAAASIGLQLGAQSKSLVVVFLSGDSLKQFRDSKGWKAGVDGSVAVVEWGAGEDINTIDIEDPIVGFVFSNKGLMFNLTLEGSKFTKIQK
ncbi:YSC84-related protein [Methylophaga sp. OBS4]|uniref:lipid-binding SYLF domain-containing protein n=1 Tax=Methylophaga sp. OBS4 TaxID=2991935 RepID=UPI00225086FB|nr:YSC84-related protein [Methylophaga sp. OBS4]MCX4187890.1 YSC84-related protein [Methylophaga sp. OBS4]